MSFIVNLLLEQIKNRRIALALKQHDMMLRIGISRQQYQRLESKGNPRLDTLELIAKGLKSELLLIPQEKLNAVLAVLAGDTTVVSYCVFGAACSFAHPLSAFFSGVPNLMRLCEFGVRPSCILSE